MSNFRAIVLALGALDINFSSPHPLLSTTTSTDSTRPFPTFKLVITRLCISSQKVTSYISPSAHLLAWAPSVIVFILNRATLGLKGRTVTRRHALTGTGRLSHPGRQSWESESTAKLVRNL